MFSRVLSVMGEGIMHQLAKIWGVVLFFCKSRKFACSFSPWHTWCADVCRASFDDFHGDNVFVKQSGSCSWINIYGRTYGTAI